MALPALFLEPINHDKWGITFCDFYICLAVQHNVLLRGFDKKENGRTTSSCFWNPISK